MIFMSDGCRLSFPPVSSLSIPVLQPEKNTKVAVMHHKCHSYLPGSPATPQTDRLVEHRNSTPAIHLKTEATSDSLTSLTPRTRTRHGTWSHCQQAREISSILIGPELISVEIFSWCCYAILCHKEPAHGTQRPLQDWFFMA